MTSTLGARRTFFTSTAWRLPDRILVIAGPFQKDHSRKMARKSQQLTAVVCLTKRLSKHSLLKQSEAGYRPSALTRILNETNERTDGAARRNIQLRNKGAGSIDIDDRRKEEGFRRATADRSPAQATERGAGGDRRSTLITAWDSRKACHTSWAERRRLSPRQAGLPAGAALVPRDLCFA